MTSALFKNLGADRAPLEWKIDRFRKNTRPIIRWFWLRASQTRRAYGIRQLPERRRSRRRVDPSQYEGVPGVIERRTSRHPFEFATAIGTAACRCSHRAFWQVFAESEIKRFWGLARSYLRRVTSKLKAEKAKTAKRAHVADSPTRRMAPRHMQLARVGRAL